MTEDENYMENKPAGFWIRALALFFDSVFLHLITGTMFFFMKDAANIETILSFLISIIYYTYFHGKTGSTLGKSALGIKVINDDNTSITYTNSLLRFFCNIIDFPLTLGFGYLIAAFNKRKKALHDYICSTKAIRINANRKLLFLLIFLTFIYPFFIIFTVISSLGANIGPFLNKHNIEISDQIFAQSDLLKGNFKLSIKRELGQSKHNDKEDVSGKLLSGMYRILAPKGWELKENKFLAPVDDWKLKTATMIKLGPITRITNTTLGSWVDNKIRSGYQSLTPIIDMQNWEIHSIYRKSKSIVYAIRNKNGEKVSYKYGPTEELIYYLRKNDWPNEKYLMLSYIAANHEIYEKYKSDYEEVLYNTKDILLQSSEKNMRDVD